jgi:hypothetical protein
MNMAMTINREKRMWSMKMEIFLNLLPRGIPVMYLIRQTMDAVMTAGKEHKQLPDLLVDSGSVNP